MIPVPLRRRTPSDGSPMYQMTSDEELTAELDHMMKKRHLKGLKRSHSSKSFKSTRSKKSAKSTKSQKHLSRPRGISTKSDYSRGSGLSRKSSSKRKLQNRHKKPSTNYTSQSTQQLLKPMTSKNESKTNIIIKGALTTKPAPSTATKALSTKKHQ